MSDAYLAAWNCWNPAPSPVDDALAFVSDRDGRPRVWIDAEGRSLPVETGPEPVTDVHWSPDGQRLAVRVVPGGGELGQIWTVRPDGGDLRPLTAPEGGTARFVRWTGRGEVLLVAESTAAGLDQTVLVDARTGARETVASGALLHPAALSRDHDRLLLRRGPRGARHLLTTSLPHRDHGENDLLPGLPGTTDYGVLGPDGDTVYLLSDAGREWPALLSVAAIDPFAKPVVLAERPGTELDQFALTPDGRRALLVWNDQGRSVLELLETASGSIRPLPGLPADVVTSLRLTLDGTRAVLAAESPDHPSHVLLCDLTDGTFTQVAGVPPIAGGVAPELVQITARDGLDLSAWLYRVPGAPHPTPYVIYLHGGPESQERPTFNPLFQHLLAGGIGVLAPNVRGSSGYGRAFREADDRDLRARSIDDVADCARALPALGGAPGRIACMGWSYGGYLTLSALVRHPDLFRAGVDVCGIADFETFYARTRPWIAAQAVNEYGTDRALLRALSPLHAIDRLRVPLLVVHGANDSNVPVFEAEQVVAATRCEYLLFPDEGHDIKLTANRAAFVRRVVDWLTPILS